MDGYEIAADTILQSDDLQKLFVKVAAIGLGSGKAQAYHATAHGYCKGDEEGICAGKTRQNKD